MLANIVLTKLAPIHIFVIAFWEGGIIIRPIGPVKGASTSVGTMKNGRGRGGRQVQMWRER